MKQHTHCNITLPSARARSLSLVGQKLYDFGSYWRDAAGNFSTFPERLKQSGYQTHSIGKVFHPLSAMKKGNHEDDFPYSWTEPGWHPSTEKFKGAAICPPLPGVQPQHSATNNKTYLNLLCPVDAATMKLNGGSLPDIQSTDRALALLANLSSIAMKAKAAAGLGEAEAIASPWFIAVGYHKPHIPLKFPAKYLDLHPLESVTAPPSPTLPALLPTVAYEPWMDVRKRDDVKAVEATFNVSFPFGLLPTNFAKQIRQHYYAAISYVDNELGRVVDALDASPFADNTIVVLFGDHGWQLGERAEWAKYSTCETATRIPLIIRVPPSLLAFTPASATAGRTSTAMIEIVDIGPTLLDFAGASGRAHSVICPPAQGNTSRSEPEDCVEGSSFKALLVGEAGDDIQNATKAWPKHAAFSQYTGHSPYGVTTNWTDMADCNGISVMGYTMRTAALRYTEWVSFSCAQNMDDVSVPIQSQADWSKVIAVELYVHNTTAMPSTSSAADSREEENNDVYEANNVAEDPQYVDLIDTLSAQLRAGWRASLY